MRTLSINLGIPDLVGILTYRILTDLDVVVIATTTIGITEPSAGVYQVSIADSIDGKIIWTYNSESFTEYFDALSPPPLPDYTDPFADLSMADAYFNGKLHTQAWDDADDTTKLKAFSEATRIINLFNYIWEKTDPDQTNEWPRNALTTLPNEILFAFYEIVYALLDGVDPERELRGIYVTSRGYSAVRTTYDTARVPEHLIVGVPSAIAWAYLRPFLRDSDTIKLRRVS